MVFKLRRRGTEAIAAIHIRQHRLLPMVPGSEARALDLVLAEKYFVPALAAAVRDVRPRPVAAPRVKLVLVITVIADVAAAALPVHGVILCVAGVDELLHRLDTLVVVKGRDVVTEGDDVVVLLGGALVVAFGVAPVDCVGGVLFGHLVAKGFIVFIRAVAADVEFAACA